MGGLYVAGMMLALHKVSKMGFCCYNKIFYRIGLIFIKINEYLKEKNSFNNENAYYVSVPFQSNTTNGTVPVPSSYAWDPYEYFGYYQGAHDLYGTKKQISDSSYFSCKKVVHIIHIMWFAHFHIVFIFNSSHHIMFTTDIIIFHSLLGR